MCPNAGSDAVPGDRFGLGVKLTMGLKRRGMSYGVKELDTSREEIKQVLSMTRPSPTFDARILEALVIPVHFVMGKGHERQSQR